MHSAMGARGRRCNYLHCSAAHAGNPLAVGLRGAVLGIPAPSPTSQRTHLFQLTIFSATISMPFQRFAATLCAIPLPAVHTSHRPPLPAPWRACRVFCFPRFPMC